MVVSPQSFPPRKRRPSAGAFMPPKFSDKNLLRSLLLLTQEISSLKPPQFLLKRHFVSTIRKVKLLSILFEELFRNPTPFLSPTILCLEELYIVLQRIKTLIEDCFNGSRMWGLITFESVSNSFHEVVTDLSTLLDILPVNEIGLTDDVKELVVLIRKQCNRSVADVDCRDKALRQEVLSVLEQIKGEIVPDQQHLSQIFANLGLQNSSKCSDEIESLEEEVRNQSDDKSKSDIVSLIGLVRYAKCVLFEPTTGNPDSRRKKIQTETNVPTDFRCPISLDMMRDPVVVATGQTYDRESISLWIESGHNTCPKTGQNLAHNSLIPNCALKNLIAMWCRQQKIPFETVDGNNNRFNGAVINKAALEATKMTVSFLVNKLSASNQSLETANGVVYELRGLAKTNSESRAFIAEAGAIPLLVRYLGSDVCSELPSLQVNAVTTLLNLSILEVNKTRIMETDGALNGVIEVLRSGGTWEAKGNAAATIFSLSGVQSYRKRLGRKGRVVKGLIELAKSAGSTNSRRDALVAILTMAADRDTVGRLLEGGVVEMVMDAMNVLPEEAVTVLEVVVKKGGLVAIAAAYNLIKKVGLLLRDGSDTARESAAATLVTICRKGGSDTVAELAAIPGIERMVWDVMGTGTMRARRKATTLLRILRRWAAGLDVGFVDDYRSTLVTTSVTSSSRVVAN